MEIEREYGRQLMQEADEKRRAYEQKKKAEREEKKRKVAEEQELIQQVDKEAKKVIERVFEDLFK